MPPLAPVIAGVGAFLATPVGSMLGNLAMSVAFSAIAEATRPKPPSRQVQTNRGFTFELTIGETLPVSAVFGLGRARGHLIYVNEYGTNNDWLQLVIAIGHGEHDGMADFLADEKIMTLSGSNGSVRGRVVNEFRLDEEGEPDPDGTPHMWVKYYTGAPGQTADPELVDKANPSNRWGEFHTATGMAYMIVTMRYHEKMGGTLPRFGSVWRGLKQYDWRFDSTMPGGSGPQRWGQPATYAFTRNPVVMRWNFRRGIYVNGVRALGQGFPLHALDIDAYTAAANVCDEPVLDPVTDTEFTRYEFGREIFDDEEKLTVLADFEAGFSGYSFKRGGADVPLPACQQTPVMTLTDDDLLDDEASRTDRRGVVSAKRTAWHGHYLSADNGWQPAPYQTRINADLETALNGRKSARLDQPFEHLEPRAQTRAEIALRRDAFPGTREEAFVPKAMRLEPGDVITRVSDWGETLMMVTSRKILEGRTGARLGLREWSNTIVPASGETFVTLPPSVGPGVNNPSRLVTLSGLDADPYDQAGGGAVHAAIRFTWAEIADPTVDQVIIRYWPTAGNKGTESKTVFASRFNQAIVVADVLPDTEYSYEGTIGCNPPRQTVFTNIGTVMTGSEQSPKVGPGGVDLDALDNRLASVVGVIFPDREGSLSSVIERLEAYIEDVAGAVARLAVGEQVALASMRDALKLERDRARVDYEHAVNLVITTEAAMGQLLETLRAAFEAEKSFTRAEFSNVIDVIATAEASLAQQLGTLNTEFINQTNQTNADIVNLAQAISDGDGALALQIDALSVSLTNGISTLEAAVLAEQNARIAGDEAVASDVTEVVARVDDVSAGGLFKVEAQAGPGGGSVRLALMGRVTTSASYKEAGFVVDVFSGSTPSEILALADSFKYWNGSLSVQPVTISGDELVLKSIRAERIRSLTNGGFDLNSNPVVVSFGG